MLNKSILLNLQIAKSDMGTLLGITISCMVLYLIAASALFLPALMFLLVALVLYIIFYIRIVNKLFFHSFFDEEGILYMTLPISAKDMVWSKILAVAGYTTLIQLLLLAGIVGGAFTAGVNAGDLLYTLSSSIPSLDGTPVETALALGLLPLHTLAAALFSSSFLLAVFLKVAMKRKKLLPCWIIYWIVNGLLNLGVEQISGDGTASLGAMIISILVYMMIFALCARYCVKCLEERYNG